MACTQHNNQLHVHCDLSNVLSSVNALEQYVIAISHWMSANWQKLNTELMWAGTKYDIPSQVYCAFTI